MRLAELGCHIHGLGVVPDLSNEYVDAINLRDPTVFPEVCGDDLILDSTAGSFEKGRPVHVLDVGGLRRDPSIDCIVDEVLVAGNTFTLRYSCSCTHLGELFGGGGLGAALVRSAVSSKKNSRVGTGTRNGALT